MLHKRRLTVIHDEVTQRLMNEVRLCEAVAGVVFLYHAVYDGVVRAETT